MARRGAVLQVPAGFARRPLFEGQFGFVVPSTGWMDTHAVEKNGLSVDGNELFVSNKVSVKSKSLLRTRVLNCIY